MKQIRSLSEFTGCPKLPDFTLNLFYVISGCYRESYYRCTSGEGCGGTRILHDKNALPMLAL